MGVKLPNAESAEVEQEKLSDYLLSEAHPVGRAKARFFRGLGFGAEHAPQLRAELLGIARTGEVAAREQTPFGTKYVVDGQLVGRGGTSAGIRTVWITEQGQAGPRLVTAYPRTRKGETS